MSDFDPLSSFVSQQRTRNQEIMQRLDDVEVMDAAGTRKFLDAKLEMQRVNWACQVGLQLRHNLLKKVTSKI